LLTASLNLSLAGDATGAEAVYVRAVEGRVLDAAGNAMPNTSHVCGHLPAADSRDGPARSGVPVGMDTEASSRGTSEMCAAPWLPYAVVGHGLGHAASRLFAHGNTEVVRDLREGASGSLALSVAPYSGPVVWWGSLLASAATLAAVSLTTWSPAWLVTLWPLWLVGCFIMFDLLRPLPRPAGGSPQNEAGGVAQRWREVARLALLMWIYAWACVVLDNHSLATWHRAALLLPAAVLIAAGDALAAVRVRRKQRLWFTAELISATVLALVVLVAVVWPRWAPLCLPWPVPLAVTIASLLALRGTLLLLWRCAESGNTLGLRRPASQRRVALTRTSDAANDSMLWGPAKGRARASPRQASSAKRVPSPTPKCTDRVEEASTSEPPRGLGPMLEPADCRETATHV
jgi:hypothetical protein